MINVPGYFNQFSINPEIPFKIRDKFTSVRPKGLNRGSAAAAAAAAKSIQLCPTPSDPMDCSLPGSSVHGILQARVLEWGAIAFSEIQGRDYQKSVFFVSPYSLFGHLYMPPPSSLLFSM